MKYVLIELRQEGRNKMRKAYFSGGRFYGLIEIFRFTPGVITVTGGTGHYRNNKAEVVEVSYDSLLLDYNSLVDNYLKQIDFTDNLGQFSDRGEAFKPIMFYQTESELHVIQDSLEKLKKRFSNVLVEYQQIDSFEIASSDPLMTDQQRILKHELLKKKEARLQTIALLWKDTYKEKLKTLTPLAFEVTKKNHTERPFTSSFSKGNEPGIYVDVISNEPLFSTIDQFDAGCGWPSFTKPITQIVEINDFSYGMHRVEIRSVHSDSHLGHVFDDGPIEKGGLRYCINGAALRFIPLKDLEKEGFKAYLALFQKNL